MVAEEIFRSDGKFRLIHRGPDLLTVDGEMSGTLTKNDVLKHSRFNSESVIFGVVVEKIGFWLKIISFCGII